MDNILDFTNKKNHAILENANDLCELLNFIRVKDISYIHILNNKSMVSYFFLHFVKYNNIIYHMDYFGQQINNCKKDIQYINNHIQNVNYKQINIKKGIILYNITKSAGHELSSILCGIYHLYTLNLLDDYTVVVSDAILLLGQCIKSIILLFFKESNVIFVDDKTIINIEESIIYTPPHNKIQQHNDMLLEKLNQHKNLIKYDNVCLIKSVIDGDYMNTPLKTFKLCYLELFKKNHYEIISPNHMDIITLFNIINNCKNIILSWGCNSWINSIFVNKKTNVMILCHIHYKNEWSNHKFTYSKDVLTLCTPICNKLIMEFDLPSELNNDITIQIQNHLKDLIS